MKFQRLISLGVLVAGYLSAPALAQQNNGMTNTATGSGGMGQQNNGGGSVASVIQQLVELHQIQNSYLLQYKDYYPQMETNGVSLQLSTIQNDEQASINQLMPILQSMNAQVNTCYNFTMLNTITSNPQSYIQYELSFSNLATNIYPTAINTLVNTYNQTQYLPMLLAIFENEAQHTSYLSNYMNSIPFTDHPINGTQTFLPLSAASQTLNKYMVPCSQLGAVNQEVQQQESRYPYVGAGGNTATGGSNTASGMGGSTNNGGSTGGQLARRLYRAAGFAGRD